MLLPTLRTRRNPDGTKTIVNLQQVITALREFSREQEPTRMRFEVAEKDLEATRLRAKGKTEPANSASPAGSSSAVILGRCVDKCALVEIANPNHRYWVELWNAGHTPRQIATISGFGEVLTIGRTIRRLRKKYPHLVVNHGTPGKRGA